MRKVPPVLDIDDHEMGSEGFFFPPDADRRTTIADRSIDWINNLYGESMASIRRPRDPVLQRPAPTTCSTSATATSSDGRASSARA